MWGLAEVVGNGMRACLAPLGGHPAGGPGSHPTLGKPSSQPAAACSGVQVARPGRPVCQEAWLAGVCAFVVDFFHGKILFWACPSNFSGALGHGQSARNSGPHCEPPNLPHLCLA